MQSNIAVMVDIWRVKCGDSPPASKAMLVIITESLLIKHNEVK
jgi:hypothetical protein